MSAVSIPRFGVPSRSNATDVASTTTSPSTPPAAARRGVASTRAWVDAGSTAVNPDVGGVVEYRPTACFVTYQPSAVTRAAEPGSPRHASTAAAIAWVE